jgi:hypothetical protein
MHRDIWEVGVPVLDPCFLHQLHAQGLRAPVTIRKDDEWAPEPAWDLPGTRSSDPSVVQPVASHYAHFSCTFTLYNALNDTFMFPVRHAERGCWHLSVSKSTTQTCIVMNSLHEPNTIPTNFERSHA